MYSFFVRNKKSFRERTLKNPTGQQGWLFCYYIGSRGALTFVHFRSASLLSVSRMRGKCLHREISGFHLQNSCRLYAFSVSQFVFSFSPLVCDSSFRPLGFPETEKRNLPLIKFPPLSLNGKQFGGISPPPLFSLRPRLSRFGTVGENSPLTTFSLLGGGKKVLFDFLLFLKEREILPGA